MNEENKNEINKIIQNQKIKRNNIIKLKKRNKKINNDIIKSYTKSNNKTFCLKKYKDNLNKNNDNDFSSQTGSTSINKLSLDLDWNDYKSIYNHLISYINLMIINLNKDNNLLCKYLKEIYFFIFDITRKANNYYKSTYINNIPNIDKNKYINDNINKKTENNIYNGEWNFITGERTSNNNIDVMEKLYEKEKKKNEEEKVINSPNIKKDENELIAYKLDKLERPKIGQILEISLLKEKVKKLKLNYKIKEKQFKIDKLNYLFRINILFFLNYFYIYFFQN